ncbi:MAG: HEAT repeat domain-containing protein, partial [Candidatus Aminicenantes bacterium]|nr:HEAT repeat domain-containing protein [Candidatus Aminicenantes bacterium]
MKRKLFKLTRLLMVPAFLATLIFATPLDSADKKDHEEFKKAKKLIYEKDWTRAVVTLKKFQEKFKKSGYLDDSLYWLSYSLSKMGTELTERTAKISLNEEAIKELNELLDRFKTSTWIEDAKILRMEIAESLSGLGNRSYRKYLRSGADADAEKEGSVKMWALDALLQMDEEKAFPILKKIIKENKDVRMREKALFIISQHDHKEVVPVLINVAKNDASRKVREKAIFWLGQMNSSESSKAIINMYDNENDYELKKKLIFSISQNDSKASVNKLVSIAKNDKNYELKKSAAFWIGQID